MIKTLKKQRASSVLGLALDGNRLEAVVVRRSGGSLQIKESFAASLALSPLGGDPELVGREIRNLLDKAGIRERRCAVSLPASWVLTVQTQLPELEEADVESFLQIEAERGFTSGYENLFVVNSRARAAGGEQFATLMALPRNHLETVEKALKAAQLKPVSFPLGITSLGVAGKDAAQGAITLAVASNSVELEVSLGGGIIAVRSLDGAIEAVGAQKRIDADLVAREIRITLGQLPAPLGDAIRTVRIFARGEFARQFISDVSPRLQSMGLKLEVPERATAADFNALPPAEVALSPALSVAANYVRGVMSGPEFLPPKISPLQQWMASRAATRKLGWAGLAGVGAAALVVGAFVVQQIVLSSWQVKWNKLKPQVEQVADAQKQIRTYRPWFDDSYRGLVILRTLVERFPEDPSVTAKSVQIKDLAEVTCSGVARDSQSYLRLLQQLRNAPGVTNVSTPMLSGQSPQITFSIKFDWVGGEIP